VLRDQRYKLLRYSKDELSIQLSNVTVQDAGTYSCFSYSRNFQSKSQDVQILDKRVLMPIKGALEQCMDGGRAGFQGDVKDFIYCSGLETLTFFSPNGRAGDTRHQLGADGRKWSTSSTLRILSYSPKVTASCIIQHPALGGERLVASFPFQDLPSTDAAEALSPSDNPTVSSSAENPAGTSPSASPNDPE
ncbi:CRTAM protein, partial [Illadopsis cleaveri]|nr:CRTAM protein [Illadopsis cleaveri]